MSKYFDPRDLQDFDRILEAVERDATDAHNLVRCLAAHRVPIRCDISKFQLIDPFAKSYKQFVGDLHREIIGGKYSSCNEGLPVLDEAHEANWPFPWGTKAPEIVGKFLVAYGTLIRVLQLPQHARILEVGCGMGSLTWNLARMGYRVDAIDPNAVQCDCVRAATQGFPVKPRVIQATLEEWLIVRKAEAPYLYDAVIFFESFHHIADHAEALKAIFDECLESDGVVALAGEPIVERQCDFLPYPWGPRLDGESFRAMRRWGWLELGFTAHYIEKLFRRIGVKLVRHSAGSDEPLATVYLARRVQKASTKPRDERKRYRGTPENGIDLLREGAPDFVKDFRGLGALEEHGRWSVGPEVVFRFCKPLPRDFVLEVEFSDVFGPNVGKSLRVVAGKSETVEILDEVERRSLYRFAFRGVRASSITFFVPQPCRPKDLLTLQSEDARRLGLRFRHLRIRPQKAAPRRAFDLTEDTE